MATKNCKSTKFIGKLLFGIALITVGIVNYQDAQTNFNPNLKFIQSFVQEQGIEVETLHLRYAHMILAYFLIIGGFLSIFCRCCVIRSLVLFAMIVLNITTLVSFSTFVKDWTMNTVQSG